MIADDVLEAPVEILGVPQRVVNALHASHIRTIGAMLNLRAPYPRRSFYNVGQLPRIHARAMVQIYDALYELLGIDMIEYEHARGNDALFDHLEYGIQVALIRAEDRYLDDGNNG